LTLAEFKSAVENKTTSDPEQYIQLAERKILPDISNPSQRDPSYQLAMLLAKHFESAHSDRFFADLMQSAGKTGFHEAVLNLGEASKANNAGHSEEAYSSATRSGELFQKLHSDAGEAASEFEEAYALHFESHAAQCAKTAAKVAETAKQRGYTWLEIQALLEQAICLNMKRDLGRAEDLALKAIALSKDHGYLGFRLRGLVLLASLEADAGNESSAWQAIREGLEQYWTGNLPPMRAYSFYMLLDSIAENLGHWNVQSAAAFEALQFIAGGPDHIIEAEERSRLAGAALHLGMPELAEEQFAEAARLFSSAPDTSSVQWRVLEARIDLASVQSLKHDHTNRAFEELLGFLPEVQRISNRYVESQYYTTLGHLKLNTGDPQTATKYLLQAINLADIGLDSLSSWQGRLKWMEQNRSPYILMTELLFRTGQQQAALDLWEHFRTASSKGFDVNSSNTRLAVISDPAKSTVHTPKVFDAKILTYAFAPDGLMLWLQDQHKLRAVFVPISLSEFKRTAATLIEECSRPDSDLSNLRQNAHRLHEWLIQPVSAWLPSSGNLIIKPDGLVGSLPVEALLDSSGAYLGERYSIIVVPALTLSNQPARAATIRASDRALIVSAPSNAKQGLEPPPGAVSEANEVGRQFTRSTVLAGGTAKVDAVRREITKNEIFHFAGHAAFGRAGAVMLLADGSLDVAGIDPKPSDGDHRTIQEPLSSMKLAVFSACGTARPNETSQWNSVVTEFLEAGTREVVASHWNVDSVTTREFMASFYRFLMSGSTVSGALQTAAAELRAKPETIHPYYWAAFSSFSAT
jgi:CHAT domain-containing protein